jgi:hypothetical protein
MRENQIRFNSVQTPQDDLNCVTIPLDQFAITNCNYQDGHFIANTTVACGLQSSGVSIKNVSHL